MKSGHDAADGSYGGRGAGASESDRPGLDRDERYLDRHGLPEIVREHAQRKLVGGKRHAREVVALQETDRTGLQPHIRRIHEHDVAASAFAAAPDEAYDLAAQILGGGASVIDRASRPGARAERSQPPGHEDTDGVVAAEVGTDAENGDPVGLRQDLL